MKHFIRSIAVIFIAAGLAISQPKLSLDNPDVEFGTMYSGAKKKAKLILRNIGNDTLHIYSVQPECGCTAVKKPKPFLLPGQSDVVELEFNSTRYFGKVEKHVTVNTNDPTSQYVSVKLLIDVREILHPMNGSYMLWMNNAIIGKPVTQTMTLKNVSGQPLKILRDSISSSIISVSLNKLNLLPDDTLTVQVSANASRLGYFNEHFDIITDHKVQPSTEVQVNFMGIEGK